MDRSFVLLVRLKARFRTFLLLPGCTYNASETPLPVVGQVLGGQLVVVIHISLQDTHRPVGIEFEMHWPEIFTIAMCASTAVAHQPIPRVGGNRKLLSELAAKKTRLTVPQTHEHEHERRSDDVEKRQNTDDQCGEDYGECAEGAVNPLQNKTRPTTPWIFAYIINY